MKSLSAKLIRMAAGSGSNLVESGMSLLLGPWLGQGLVAQAAAHKGPGRAAGPRCAISFDVDFQEDVFALEGLLNHLEAHSIKASFALVGRWVDKYPREHKTLVESGHEIVNHTLTHPDNEELDPDRHFHLLPPDVLAEQIRGGHDLIEKHLGIRPRGFRAPHFGHQHTVAVYPVLRELGYTYSSSTLAPRSPSWGWPHPVGGGLWELPVTVCPRHPFSSFDTWHFIRKQPSRHKAGDLLRHLEGLVEKALAESLPLAFYFDPRDAAKAGSEKGECLKALELLAGSGLNLTTFGDWADELDTLNEST